MITKCNLVGTVLLIFFAWSAQAGVIINGDAVFDDTNDLLSLTGTYTSSSVPIDGFIFDWDGIALSLFDFSTSSLVASNIGGALSTPAPGFVSGSIMISGFLGAPLSVPVTFDFLLSVPGAGNSFLSTPIDFYLCGSCNSSPVFDYDNPDFITPRSGVLAAVVPAPATLALFGLGLAGLGWSKRKKT